MNKKLKKIITVVLCLCLTLGTYFYIGRIVTPKDMSDSGSALYFNGMGFLAEPKNSLDLVVYGNSDVYSGFSPAVLMDKFGYNSYASGRARQNVENINDLLKKTLQKQDPKLVILETDCFFEESSGGTGDFNVFLPPFIYHSRWKEIKLRDFYKSPNREHSIDVNKGYIKSNLVYESDYHEDYMGDPNQEAAEITESNKKHIAEFIKTCHKDNIEVLLVELPSPYSWDYSKHNAVKALAEEHDVTFIDMNIGRDSYGLNPKTDFRDNGNHLNHSGATKATEYLGEYIKKNYGDLFAERSI